MIRIEADTSVVQRYFEQLDAAAHAVGATRLQFSSSLPYVYGIETGRRRSGRLARRAGGAWMFQRGLARSQDQLASMVADGLPYGPGGINAAVQRWGRNVALPAIRSYTPVRTGALRASVRVGRI